MSTRQWLNVSEVNRTAWMNALPKGLQKSVTSNNTQTYCYQSAGHLDRVESWLFHHLQGVTHAEFEEYPPWAMLNSQVTPYTQWWGSVGHLEMTRDGVHFLPADVLQVSSHDLHSFWSVVSAVLHAHGWSLLKPHHPNLHELLVSERPVPMEQASPWSVQGLNVGDVMVLDEACADWRRLWHELQVELAQAPFNQVREENNLKPLNTLWFWGGGKPWLTQHPLPKAFSVSEDGVYELLKMTNHADPISNRFIFWLNTLAPLFSNSHELKQASRVSVYCVEFEGWADYLASSFVTQKTENKIPNFQILQTEVIAPMQLAGLSFEWVLLGQRGYKTVQSTWRDRWRFWRRQPDWRALIEPDDEFEVSEEQLKAAWHAGQRDQDAIQSQWEQSK